MTQPAAILPTRRHLLAGAVAAGLAGGAAAAVAGPVTGRPLAPRVLVIGHRGAPALRPEHTLASYALAIADGADFVEPDLVVTRDGVLVARHESNITETTDVAARLDFAGRRNTRTVDGVTASGWFTVDFTLAELKTLRAKERLPALRPQNTAYDDRFQIPTFEEIVDFVAAESAARGRTIGLIPELKSTPFLRSVGLPTEDRFVDLIDSHWYTRTAPLEVQCFYGDSLRHVRSRIGRGRTNTRLMQLMETATVRFPPGSGNGHFNGFGEMATPAGLQEIASYADVIGPDKLAIIPLGPDGRLGQPTRLVYDAHRAGLLVHPYTFRPENHFLPADFRDGPDGQRNPAGSVAEIRRYLATGIDGFFTDDPAIGRQAVDRATPG